MPIVPVPPYSLNNHNRVLITFLYQSFQGISIIYIYPRKFHLIYFRLKLSTLTPRLPILSVFISKHLSRLYKVCQS